MNKKKLYEKHFGYYTVPFSGEPFEGEVIKLDGKSARVYFNVEGSGNEYKFRDKLERMDSWFYDKPYRVQQKWQELVMKWLANQPNED